MYAKRFVLLKWSDELNSTLSKDPCSHRMFFGLFPRSEMKIWNPLSRLVTMRKVSWGTVTWYSRYHATKRTGWHIRLRKTSRCFQNKSYVLAWPGLAWPGLAWPGQSGTFVLKLTGGFAQPDVSPYTFTRYKYTLLITLESTRTWPVKRATMSTRLFVLIVILGVATIANATQGSSQGRFGRITNTGPGGFHRCQCCEDDPPPQCNRLNRKYLFQSLWFNVCILWLSSESELELWLQSVTQADYCSQSPLSRFQMVSLQRAQKRTVNLSKQDPGWARQSS